MAHSTPKTAAQFLQEIAEAESAGTRRPLPPSGNPLIAIVVAAACGDPTDPAQIEAMKKRLDASVEHHGYFRAT